jgi:hypothetical protein
MKNLLNQFEAQYPEFQGAPDSVYLHEDFINLEGGYLDLRVHRALVSHAVQPFVHLLCLLLHPKTNGSQDSSAQYALHSDGMFKNWLVALLVSPQTFRSSVHPVVPFGLPIQWTQHYIPKNSDVERPPRYGNGSRMLNGLLLFRHAHKRGAFSRIAVRRRL